MNMLQYVMIAGLALVGSASISAQTLFPGVQSTHSQPDTSRESTIISLQYYWNDGQWSSAQTQNLVPDWEIDTLVNIAAESIPPGLNMLHYRVRNSNGAWSLPQHRLFHVTRDDLSLQPVNKLEYFVDSDPGPGLGMQIVLPANIDVQQMLELDLTQVPAGVHQLGVRVQNVEGKWSLPLWRQILRVPTQTASNIVSITWYFTGSGVDQSETFDHDGLTPGQAVIEEHAIPLTHLVQGQSYRMHVYASSAQGKRSHEIVVPFTLNWIPSDFTHTITNGLYTLGWDEIIGATAYRLLAADNLNAGFQLIATTPNTWWTEPVSDKRFFRIVAIRE
jgi:hypothetical protein